MSQTAQSKFTRAAESGDAVAIQGFSQLQRALARIGDEVQPELRRRLKEVGERVALVAASNAPRGPSGDLQTSIKTSIQSNGASVYSTSVYGGAINYGAFPKLGASARGPHIKRANASHYMDRAVTQLAPWVEQETEAVMDWLMTTFQED